MKSSLATLTGVAALAAATPAAAHGGAHTDGFVVHLVHWMSSPVHGSLVLVGAIALGFVVLKTLRKKA